MSVRVRFAPSPTGTLHVGSARTALFNWLFAKHEGGTFILRVEDTDQKRSDKKFLEDIFGNLDFLGITTDEGPYYQSERFDIYRKYAQQLLDEGKAVEEDGAIVFKVPLQSVTFKDVLRKDITVQTDLFDSLVLMKSDGSPAYNFCCVVDDALMKITHVVRGDDHIANTPKQVVLYKALGFEVPLWVHIPLIVGPDRARLSKRTGATSIIEYRKQGYLPEALFNYLSLLGWSPGDNREMVSPEEIVKLFDIKRVKKTAAMFDMKKLEWLNSKYIKEKPTKELAPLLAERLLEAKMIESDYDQVWFERVVDVSKDRMRLLQDIVTQYAFFFCEIPEYKEEAVEKHLTQEGIEKTLSDLAGLLKTAEPFDTETCEKIVRAYQEEQGLETKQLIHPVRVAITGSAVSPPLFDVMSVLGKDRVLKRLEHTLKNCLPGAKPGSTA